MHSLQMFLQAFTRPFTWMVIVAPWEQALRVRAGKNVSLLKAGIYLRIPFVDRVYRHTTRRRLTVVRPQTLTTKDRKTLTLAGSLGYEIVDLRKLFDSLHSAEDTIEAEVTGKVAEYVATHSLDQCSPEEVEKHVRDAIDLTRYGLGRQEFFLTNFATVKTYRIITGELPAWSQGDILNTTRDDTPRDL